MLFDSFLDCLAPVASSQVLCGKDFNHSFKTPTYDVLIKIYYIQIKQYNFIGK